MSSYAELIIIAEGQTEQKFINMVLAPYLSERNIYVRAPLIGKPGHKGGDVRFPRFKNDMEEHLKQRPDTFVSIFIDYYGLGEWPGLEKAKEMTRPLDKATAINKATVSEVKGLFGKYRPEERFIPYIAMHEFEALLFSDLTVLSDNIDVDKSIVEKILNDCGEPENINNSPQTAPSKRLEKLYDNYKKTVTGIAIAEEIGIDRMREQCPIFNEWLTQIETLPNK